MVRGNGEIGARDHGLRARGHQSHQSGFCAVLQHQWWTASGLVQICAAWLHGKSCKWGAVGEGDKVGKENNLERQVHFEAHAMREVAKYARVWPCPQGGCNVRDIERRRLTKVKLRGIKTGPRRSQTNPRAACTKQSYYGAACQAKLVDRKNIAGTLTALVVSRKYEHSTPPAAASAEGEGPCAAAQ
eukprot:4497136-Pleurochrysis_carterae.AAC.1